MSANSIRLMNYFFPRVHLDANPRFDANEFQRVFEIDQSAEELGIPEPDSKIDLRRLNSDDHPKFVAIQKIKLDCQQNPFLPYSFDVECVGMFEWVGPLKSEEEMVAGVTVVAHSVLYGASREMILSTSSRGPHGGFILSIAILRDKPASPAAPPAAPPAQ